MPLPHPRKESAMKKSTKPVKKPVKKPGKGC
jgi:hypothetical protein